MADYPLKTVLDDADWGTVTFQCRSGVCQLTFNGTASNNSGGAADRKLDIPEEYRPKVSIQQHLADLDQISPTMTYKSNIDATVWDSDREGFYFSALQYAVDNAFRTYYLNFVWLVQ